MVGGDELACGVQPLQPQQAAAGSGESARSHGGELTAAPGEPGPVQSEVVGGGDEAVAGEIGCGHGMRSGVADGVGEGA